jgi:hypothetical protein
LLTQTKFLQFPLHENPVHLCSFFGKRILPFVFSGWVCLFNFYESSHDSPIHLSKTLTYSPIPSQCKFQTQF